MLCHWSLGIGRLALALAYIIQHCFVRFLNDEFHVRTYYVKLRAFSRRRSRDKSPPGKGLKGGSKRGGAHAQLFEKNAIG